MKFCNFCAHNNGDEATFCDSCGTPLDAQTLDTKTANQSNRGDIKFPTNNDFISADEYVVATLTNGIVDNILSGEGLKEEDAILTNKRLYYNHKTGLINTHTQNEKVNVKDITGTKISTFNPVGLLLVSIFAIVLGIVSALASEDVGLLALSVPIALAFALAYLIAKKAYLKIEYAGGSIGFSVRKYGKENISNFQKCIYAVKDRLDESDK